MGSQAFFKLRELYSSGEMEVPQEIDNLFKTRIIVHKLGNIVASIGELIVLNGGNPCITGYHIFHSHTVCHFFLLYDSYLELGQTYFHNLGFF